MTEMMELQKVMTTEQAKAPSRVQLQVEALPERSWA
jgi:hypothetical protein